MNAKGVQKGKFQIEYDSAEDVLLIYSQGRKVKESIEVTEDLVVDLDQDNNISAIELFDAYQFLHALNSKISKEMLSEAQEVELKLARYRNYWIVTIFLKCNGQIIEEKLPAFSTLEYESPLLASA